VTARRREEGGLLIILMVWVAIMSIFAGVAYQSWSIVWRRDNEEELIFRGHQYVDAIIAYRREHNKQFPGDLDELMKPGPRQVRYIRKLYRDPMTHNGKWGLLYLMPGGTAIYDPVAAQKAPALDENGKPVSDDTRMTGAGMTPGVTPITMDPNGTMGNRGVANLMGGAMGLGDNPAAGIGGATGRGLGPGAGGRPSTGGAAMGLAGGITAVGGSPGGMSLPPPKPATDADEKSASEPPIGWPIVGVISRLTGKLDEDTMKIYEGHDRVSDWQFHVFEHPLDPGQTPMGVGGASNQNCIGPGYGGCGPIGGIGGGINGGGAGNGGGGGGATYNNGGGPGRPFGQRGQPGSPGGQPGSPGGQKPPGS
jgi:type II secretory pathway pseudopilin PulG